MNEKQMQARLERQAFQRPVVRDAALHELVTLPPDAWTPDTKNYISTAILAPLRGARLATASEWSTGEILRDIQVALVCARDAARRQVELRDFGRDGCQREWPMLSDRKQRIAALQRVKSSAAKLVKWTEILDDEIELTLFHKVRQSLRDEEVGWLDAPHLFRDLSSSTVLRSLLAEFFALVRSEAGRLRSVLRGGKEESPALGADAGVLERVEAAAAKLAREAEALDYQIQFEMFVRVKGEVRRYSRSAQADASPAVRARSSGLNARSPMVAFSAAVVSGAGELLSELKKAPVERASRSDEVLMGYAHAIGAVYEHHTGRRPARVVQGDGLPGGRFLSFLRVVTPSWLGGEMVTEHVARTVADGWKKNPTGFRHFDNEGPARD